MAYLVYLAVLAQFLLLGTILNIGETIINARVGVCAGEGAL